MSYDSDSVVDVLPPLQDSLLPQTASATEIL